MIPPSRSFRLTDARVRRGPPRRLLLSAALLLSATPLAAQEEVAKGPSGALRVFFDCEGGGRFGICNFDFYRREIPT